MSPPSGELKTKPTQHSVKELRSHRHPARRACLRCEATANSAFGAQENRAVLQRPRRGGHSRLDVKIHLRGAAALPRAGPRRQVLAPSTCSTARRPTSRAGTRISERVQKPEGTVRSPSSANTPNCWTPISRSSEALTHGGFANSVKVDSMDRFAKSSRSEDSVHHLEDVHGILVPGGFGERGAEGKIAAATFSREHNVPYLASASACRWPSSRPRAISPASQTPTRPSSAMRRPGRRPVHRMDARQRTPEPARSGRQGRHHAPRRLCLRPNRNGRASGSTATRKSQNATATVTRSTSPTATRLEKPGSSSRGMSPDARCPRSSSSKATPGTSASSFTPSSSPNPSRRIPCSHRSSRRPSPNRASSDGTRATTRHWRPQGRQ